MSRHNQAEWLQECGCLTTSSAIKKVKIKKQTSLSIAPFEQAKKKKNKTAPPLRYKRGNHEHHCLQLLIQINLSFRYLDQDSSPQEFIIKFEICNRSFEYSNNRTKTQS